MTEETKITLPKELQREMLKFFLQTSIPRKKQEKQKDTVLSENAADGGGEK